MRADLDLLSTSDRDEAVFSSLPPHLRTQIEGFAEAALHRLAGQVSPVRLQGLADRADERAGDLEAEGERGNAMVGYAIAAAFRRLATALRRPN